MFEKHPPDRVWPFSFSVDINAIFIISVIVNIWLTWYILKRLKQIQSAWQALFLLSGGWSITMFLIRIDGVFALYIFLLGSLLLNLFAFNYTRWNLKES